MVGYFIYLILKGFSFLINLFPERFALWVGRQVGNVAYYLDWEHRNVALQNLHIAFGQEKSEEEKLPAHGDDGHRVFPNSRDGYGDL
jgi:lauroyl/myristoyl acyltransferase